MNSTIIYLIGHYGVGKLTIARAICAATDATELLRIEHPNRLDIDTTHLPPHEVARQIIEHAERLA